MIQIPIQIIQIRTLTERWGHPKSSGQPSSSDGRAQLCEMRFGTIGGASTLALAAVLAFAAVVAGFATTLAFTVVLALAGVLGRIGLGGDEPDAGLGVLRYGSLAVGERRRGLCLHT